MPRARNTSTGASAEAFDAAARAFDEAEKALEAARARFHETLVAAIADEMSFAEAGRRSGYSREHLSKLHAKLTAPEAPRKKVGRPRKATPPATD
jgi:hypothetical protein